MWSPTIYLIFLYCYTSNGQIMQVPLNEQNGKLQQKGIRTLIGEKKVENPERLIALKARKPIITFNSQWEKEKETPTRWPNGRIQYFVDEDSYDKGIEARLDLAFYALAGHDGCPEFKRLSQKPTGNVGSWLHFTNPERVRSCVHDPVIDMNGEIVVVLGYDCLKQREILHAVLHGLGFQDEVAHPKRDLFIRVMWNNIQPAFRSMFRIGSAVKPGGLLEYDPKSIMHFHDHAYSLNGEASIASLLPGLRIEPSNGLSHLDKMKIRLMFAHECKKRQVGQIIDSCAAHNDLYNNINNRDDQTVIMGNDVTGVMPDYGGIKSDASNDDDIKKDNNVDDGNVLREVTSDNSDSKRDTDVSSDSDSRNVNSHDKDTRSSDSGSSGESQIWINGKELILPQNGTNIVINGNNITSLNITSYKKKKYLPAKKNVTSTRSYW